MKRIVISRKGFDSSTGKKPNRASPVFDDGKIFSIPVHIDNDSPHTFEQVNYGGINAYEAIKYVYSNSRKEVYSKDDVCHFDPNLSILPGLFGQQGKDQGELEKGGIDRGDLFLFFGWFKTYYKSINPEKPTLDCHHLFGWLQIDLILKGTQNIQHYCEENNVKHPHAFGSWSNNTLYVSTVDLNSVYGIQKGKGSGLFRFTDERLVLSEHHNKTKSMWKMPTDYFEEIGRGPAAEDMFVAANSSGPSKWFNPKQLTINTNLGNWQEMVLNSEKFLNIEKWAFDLIKAFG